MNLRFPQHYVGFDRFSLTFDVAVDRLTFVSNAKLSVTLADASDSKVKEPMLKVLS
jgi:hypothetical protein